MHRIVCDASHSGYVRRATHVLWTLDLLVQMEGSSAMIEIAY